MKTLNLIRSSEDKGYLYRKVPREDHCSTLVNEDTQFYLDGELRGIYLQHWEPAESLRKHILSIKRWDSGTRTSGVATLSRNFGFSPRNPLMQGRDYCKRSLLARDYREVSDALWNMSAQVEEVLKLYSPDRQARQEKEVHARVRPEYIIPGSSFTSGICNKNNPLQYHYDAGNFEGFFSAMLAFKSHTSGGHLNLPEYDLKLDIGDCSLCLFDGQTELHGVTPIIRDGQGYRFTIVFYTLEALWKCLPYTEELRRAQISRTKSEMKRAGITK